MYGQSLCALDKEHRNYTKPSMQLWMWKLPACTVKLQQTFKLNHPPATQCLTRPYFPNPTTVQWWQKLLEDSTLTWHWKPHDHEVKHKLTENTLQKATASPSGLMVQWASRWPLSLLRVWLVFTHQLFGIGWSLGLGRRFTCKFKNIYIMSVLAYALKFTREFYFVKSWKKWLGKSFVF